MNQRRFLASILAGAVLLSLSVDNIEGSFAGENDAEIKAVGSEFMLENDVLQHKTLDIKSSPLDDISGLARVELSDGMIGIASLALLESEESFSKAVGIALQSNEHILLWPETGENSTFEVEYKGKIIYSGKDENSLVISNDTTNSIIEYIIRSFSPLPEEQLLERFTDEEIAQIKNGTMAYPEDGYQWGITMLNPALLSSEEAIQNELLSALPSFTYFRYRTFINQNYYGTAFTCPFWLPEEIGSHYFKGDNRGYSATAGSHRTQAQITIDWNNATTSFSKNVGSTGLYKKVGSTYQFVESKTSSNSLISYSVSNINTSFAGLSLSNEAKNPFCAPMTSPIWVQFNMNVTRIGSYSIFSGSRRPVPHHEAYIRNNSTAIWTTVLQKPIHSGGFWCFAPFADVVCGHESLVTSGTY